MKTQGSIWRKWDLHVHSPASVLNNSLFEGATTDEKWSNFFAKLKALTGVSVIGITDYFSIEGYLKVVKEGKLTNLDLIIPNIELRILPVTSTDNPINIHLIVNPEIVDELESKLFSSLEFTYNAQTYKCIRSDLVRLGKAYKNDQLLDEDAAYRSGVEQFKTSLEQLRKILQDKRLAENVVIAVSNNSNDGNSGIQHSSMASTREEIYRMSHFVLSGNPSDREYFLGNGADSIDEVKRKYGSLKACIHGSDSHSLDSICKPCSKRGVRGHDCNKKPSDCDMRFCWIKADPTFDGLKQLSYEPSERVKIQEKDPTPVKSNYTIKKIKISESVIGDELKINETEIELNSALVSVTGGKGSGKTAFVDLLANCYKDRCKINDPNSFVRRITSDQKPTVNIELTFRDGTVFSKNVTDGNFFEHSEVVYIAQGELEGYISDDSDLDDYINRLIFDSPVIKDTEIAFEFEQLQSEIVLNKKTLKLKNGLIAKLEESTNDVSVKSVSVEKKKIEADIKDISNRIIESEKIQTLENKLVAQTKQAIVANLKEKKEELLNIQSLLRDAVDFATNDIASFNVIVESINVLLKKQNSKKRLPVLAYVGANEPQVISREIQTELTKIVKELEKAQKGIESLEIGVKNHAKLLDRQKELEQDLIKIQKKESDLTKDQETLVKELKSREDIFSKVLSDTFLLKKKYEEIISIFSTNKDDVLSDLSFSAKINYSQSKFEQGAEDILDQRKVRVSHSKEEESIFLPLLLPNREFAYGDESKITNIVKQSELFIAENKDKIKNSQGISTVTLYDLVYGDYYSVVPIVKYKGTQLHKLSLGQKATVLMKIYLAQGDKPIIIDSHDDHLDNEFIMDELVRAIRQAKQYRQVILASNNGNVVINSDSEQIIIATRKDGEISYCAGSIENPEIHTRAIKVLEGGSDAFRQRQQKYRISE